MKTKVENKPVLFMNVPVGAVIRFNGCKCLKLDVKHVKFLTGSTGEPVDYSKPHNKRYARATQQQIEGTPVHIISLPVVELIHKADALICEAKRHAASSPLMVEDLHAANLALSDALTRLETRMDTSRRNKVKINFDDYVNRG